MSRIFVTGDVHAEPSHRLGFQKFPESRNLTKNDYLIIVGDFGCIWNKENFKNEQYELKFLNNCPFTTLFIGGNHENWDRLREFPVEYINGNFMAKVSDSVYFIPNGTILNIDGRKIFCFGGAMSTDRGGLNPNTFYPEEGKSWWRGEIPTKEEMNRGIILLEDSDNVVDFVITHTMPIHAIQDFSLRNGYHMDRTIDPTSSYLTFVYNNIKFKNWFCGHFHKNDIFGQNITCLYENIIDMDTGINYNTSYWFESNRLWV